MFDDFNSFDQAFSQASGDGESPVQNQPLRRRKPLKQKIVFWSINAIVMPLVALCYLSIGAEGLRRTMGIFSMRLYKLPVPGAGLLRQYDGWDRLDLSMLMALVLFGAVTFLWGRVFTQLMGFGNLIDHRARKPVLFYMLVAIAGIVVLGDMAIFYIGLESQTAGSWGDTPPYVPALATIVYMAGLALIGAWHADYHCSGIV